MFSFTLVVHKGTVFRFCACVVTYYLILLCVFRKSGYIFLYLIVLSDFYPTNCAGNLSKTVNLSESEGKGSKERFASKRTGIFFISTGYPNPSVHQPYHNHPYGPIPCRGWEDGSRMPNTPKRFNDWYWITVLVGFYSQTLNILLMAVIFDHVTPLFAKTHNRWRYWRGGEGLNIYMGGKQGAVGLCLLVT